MMHQCNLVLLFETLSGLLTVYLLFTVLCESSDELSCCHSFTLKNIQLVKHMVAFIVKNPRWKFLLTNVF